MGVRTIVVSDYSGDELPDDTKPTKLAIQPAGITAKDATTLEIYISESELAELVDNVESGQPIIPRSQPASRSASRSTSSSNTPPVNEKQKEAWAKFLELKPEGSTNAELPARLKAGSKRIQSRDCAVTATTTRFSRPSAALRHPSSMPTQQRSRCRSAARQEA